MKKTRYASSGKPDLPAKPKYAPTESAERRAPAGAATKKPRNLAHVARDRGYRFKDRDPVLDDICRLITDSALSAWVISQQIAKISGGGASVSKTTIRNWLSGKVRRPVNYGVTWVGLALGYERKFVRISEPAKRKR